MSVFIDCICQRAIDIRRFAVHEVGEQRRHGGHDHRR
jgi:hypothetical protein